MSDHTQNDVSPRAILLALEINRQCDQLLAIIAEMRDKLDKWNSQLKAENDAAKAELVVLGYKPAP